jgi:DNA-binding transcriptional LysR family regulator
MDLLVHMQVFVRVAEMRSLSAAARALHVSLPTVSRQLSTLEAELGVPLVARTTRKTALTPAGERFYGHCLRVQQELDEARKSISDEADAGGIVVVSTPVTLGLSRLGPAIPLLRARHPRIVLELRLEDRVADLVTEGVDIAVRAAANRSAGSDVITRKVASWPSVLVASPGYLRERAPPTTPAALAQHRLLAHAPGTATGVQWLLQRKGRRITVPVVGDVRTNNVLLLRDLAIAGEGIALLPEWLVAEALLQHDLVRVLPPCEGPTINAHLLHRAGAPPRVSIVLDVLARVLRERAGA